VGISKAWKEVRFLSNKLNLKTLMEAYTEEVKGKMKIGKAIAERKHGEEER